MCIETDKNQVGGEREGAGAAAEVTVYVRGVINGYSDWLRQAQVTLVG